MWKDERLLKKINQLDIVLKLAKSKLEKQRLRKIRNSFIKELADYSRKEYLTNFLYKPEKFIECNDCKKKLKQKDAAYAWNSFYCPICYLKADKQARDEVARVFSELTTDV